jgi:hypothetical protein
MEESYTTSSNRWLRYAMPSVADLIFLALLVTLLFTPLSRRLLGDAGIGWHIRTGQLILTTHAIPRVDPFSSTMGGKPWFAWEWLYDLIVGWLESYAGLNGVVWFTAVVIASVFAAAFRLLIRHKTNLIAAVVLVLLALSASTIHFLARPHVLTWLFTLVWFAILDAAERSGRSRSLLWTLPLLMLLWVNLHGGFLVGFVLLAIFWLSALWSWVKTKSDCIEDAFEKITARRRTIDVTIVSLFSALTSLINPHGWNLYHHVFSYLSSRFLMNHIDEFRSPDFHGVAPRCFLILLLISIAAVAVCGRKLRLSGILTLLFAVYAALYASRNIPVSAILLIMVIGPLFRRSQSTTFGSPAMRNTFLTRMSAVESSLRGHTWPALAVILTCLVAAHGHAKPGSVLDIQFDPARMPVAAVNYLQLNGVRGPVLAPDYWGGYLIYRIYPAQRVVVDDRHDLYGEEFFKSYLKMIRVEPGWQQFLDDHPACCLLLPRDSALAAIISTRPEWRVAYADNLALVFMKFRRTD